MGLCEFGACRHFFKLLAELYIYILPRPAESIYVPKRSA
jgi:hypothetical protein